MLKKFVTLAGTLVFSIIVIYLSFEYFTGFLAVTPDFRISANPQSLVLYKYKGSSNSTVINFVSTYGFNGNVSLSITRGLGVIGDVRLDLNFYQVNLVAGGEAQVVLNLYVTTAIAPGEYYVEVTATAGETSHSIRVSISVPD